MTGFDLTGQRRVSPWRVAVVLIVLLIVGLGADWYQQNREMDHLLDATVSSETAMKAFIAEEKRIITSPPVVVDGKVTGVAEMQAAAADGAAQILTTGDDVRDVVILPWHHALRKAQQRYLAHSKAWQVYLVAAARDFHTMGGGQPEISGTFLSAAKAYRAALPPFARHDARKRVDGIFDE